MHNTDNGRTALAALNAERFIETSDSEFNELRQMAGDIGIDIRTYQFRDSR
jgi:hypothetical protein